MPELPEVETIVCDLRPRLVGRVIERVEVFWPGTLGGMAPEEFARRLAGRHIEGLARRGKHIVLRLSGGEVLITHLRMTGRLILAGSEEEPLRYLRVLIHLDNGEELRFGDLRKFARVQLLPAAEVARLNARLGPEPLADDFSIALLGERLAVRRSRLKPLLLDQSFVAGVGNIYADEALFVAGIHPNRLAHTLTAGETARLHGALRAVLAQGMRNRGTTFNDYRDGRGQPGLNQTQLYVYRRAGEPCRTCGTPVERLRFGGRGTHFCPRCQPVEEWSSGNA